AVMLPLLPVLLVDDLPPLPGKRRGADFLQVALGSAGDPTRVVRSKIVPLEELITALTQDVGPEPSTKPRVLILCDVPQLTKDQRDAVGRFVENGGGLLVTSGPRTDGPHYNKELYRNGQGWLPTTLEEQLGNEDDPIPTDGVTMDLAAHPSPA